MEENQDNSNSLETADSSLPIQDTDSLGSTTDIKSEPDKVDVSEQKLVKRGSPIHRLIARVNIYMLGFILLILISFIIIFVVIQSGNRQAAKDKSVSTQELTQDAIDSLTSNEATVGDPKQLLNIESNAVFAGKVLIRDGLDVAGPIKVGGELNLPGITVSGKSAFDEVQLNSLSIARDTGIQGQLTVRGGLTVNGKTSFGGPISATSLTLDSLSLTGDIQFSRHIDAGGPTPGVSKGGSVGAGGTVTISGTDTAGTVTVNAGSGAGNGVLANVTFSSAFNGNPHVVFTPVTSSSSLATGSYYLSNRSASGFTIAAGPLSGAGSISFDYIVID